MNSPSMRMSAQMRFKSEFWGLVKIWQLVFICTFSWFFFVHLLGTFNLIDNQEWLHNSLSSIPSFKNKDINLSENIFSLSVREFFGGGKYLYLCCFPVGTMLGWVWVWAYWLELTVRRIFWQHLLVCSTEYQMEFRPWIYYCQDQSMSLGWCQPLRSAWP